MKIKNIQINTWKLKTYKFMPRVVKNEESRINNWKWTSNYLPFFEN